MPLSVVYPPPGPTTLPAPSIEQVPLRPLPTSVHRTGQLTDLKTSSSIVAVHGLGGDAFKTWTHPKSNAFWLKDFLPEHIHDARILTFGYDAAAAFGRSTSDIVDHAKSLLGSLIDKRDETETRPLLFIAHSLGGIVVKQALLQARLEPRYQSICDATLGIIFFGTPHRGSDKAGYGKVLADVAQTVLHRPKSNLMKALEKNSDFLQRLTTDFRHQLPQYHIVSFYERHSMKPLNTLIVEKDSALLEAAHEEQLPVEADHSAMCKFEAIDNDTFEKTYMRVRRMRKSVKTTVEQLVDAYNKFFEVPHLLSPVFTGQTDVCQQLDNSLALAPITSRYMQRRFVLYGLGGSGKTQICLKYTQIHREKYWGIFWVDASTRDNIQRYMTQISLLLQIDQNIDSVKRALANAFQPWLLIFDNADDPDLQLAPYFPTGNCGDIIITSRNPMSCHYNTVGFHELAQMSLGDAEMLLLNTVCGTSRAVETSTKEVCQVVEQLGCLALAITQAGAYIRETCCTFEEYLALYDKHQNEFLRYKPKHSATDYSHTVYTTWQVSVDKIESMHDTTSDSALKLLKLLGFYHYDSIPLAMFQNAWENLRQLQIDCPWAPWSSDVSEESDLRNSIRASVVLLTSFSLINRDSSETLSLHPLVHDWCRQRLHEAEQQSTCENATTLLVESVAWRFLNEDYSFRRSLVPHVYTCIRLSRKTQGVLDLATAKTQEVMALILTENGAVQDALSLQEQIVLSLKSRFGEDHPYTLASTRNLAINYSHVGRTEEALLLMEQVESRRKTKLGEEHPDTLASMHSLASCYYRAGRTEEALLLVEQVVSLREIKLGEDHPDTLASTHTLAINYLRVGRTEEALLLIEQVVSREKTKLGKDHPDTLVSMHDLASCYYKTGRTEEALILMKQVVALREIRLSEEHPETLTSMHNLVVYYCSAGRMEEARILIERVVALREIRLGKEHPDTLLSRKLLVVMGEAENNISSGQASTQAAVADLPNVEGEGEVAKRSKFKDLWRRLRS